MSEMQGLPPDPGTEKRVLLAFVLTFVVIALMQPLVSRYYRQQQPAAQEQKQATPANQSAAQSASQNVTQTTAPTPHPSAPSAKVGARKTKTTAPVETKQATAAAETVVENDLYRITFTNRGAQVKSWILKKYKQEDKVNPLDLG